MKKTLTALLLGLLTSVSLYAQVSKTSPLFQALKTQDSLFFERGFNQCDMAYLDKAIHKDLTFYHDQSGIQNRKVFFENTQKYICGDRNKKPIRKVAPESLEVFPLYNNGVLYGAIQNGVHNFYIREPGRADVPTGRARFTHLYLLEKETWLLKEVLSFDHHDPKTVVAPDTTDLTIEVLLKREKVPALGLGIIEEGKLKQVQVFGALQPGVAAPYNALFRVASLTKPVVAMVTLRLVSDGKLGLDEPLDQYWKDPELANNKWTKKLTPRIVLTHQTGFPNWRWMTTDKKLAFQFEPGTRHQYSGEGFEYLRKALEKKFGTTLEALSDSLIFRPAGMKDTHYWWDPSVDESRYARNHDKNGKPYQFAKYYEANAAANLLTTVEDYGNFVAYVLNGGGLSQKVYSDMTQSHIKLKERDYFGLGWEKLTDFSNGEYALLHTGKDDGVSTLAILFPKSKKGYVIFLNGDNFEKVYETLLTKYMYLGTELWDRR